MSSTQLTIPQVRPRRARAARATADAPWAPGDRLVTGAFLTLGTVLILIAWIGASNTTEWDTQLSWTALSMVGVVVVCVGVGIWLFCGFARVRAEAREVRRLLAARIAPTVPGKGPSTTDVIRSVRVTVAGMAHHHSPDCLLVRGKTTTAASHELAPCGVCA